MKTIKTLNVTDIVWAEFPYDEGDGKKVRPAIILDIDDCGRICVAYGSTKKVQSAPMPHEMNVTFESCGKEAMEEMGLERDGRFDLSKRRWIVVELAVKDKIGTMPKRLLRRFMSAASAAGLI